MLEESPATLSVISYVLPPHTSSPRMHWSAFSLSAAANLWVMTPLANLYLQKYLHYDL